LATNGPFSSNWTSRVRGGKSHELLVSVVGVLSGGAGESDDGVAVDADESSGGADAAPLVEVFEHREGPLLGQVAAVQRRALALGEAGAAGVAGELPELLVLAEAAADRAVTGVTAAVEGASRVLAAETCEVVQEADRAGRKGAKASSR
jgi:hypothetical protein